MKCDLKKLIGTEVFYFGEKKPWGTVSSLCISEISGCIEAILVKTLSIIPIERLVYISDVYKLNSQMVMLNKWVSLNAYNKDENNFIAEKEILGVGQYNKKRKSKISNIKFDFETGEITDIVIKRNIFNKKEKLSVNKLKIKDNTIYIE